MNEATSSLTRADLDTIYFKFKDFFPSWEVWIGYVQMKYFLNTFEGYVAHVEAPGS